MDICVTGILYSLLTFYLHFYNFTYYVFLTYHHVSVKSLDLYASRHLNVQVI